LEVNPVAAPKSLRQFFLARFAAPALLALATPFGLGQVAPAAPSAPASSAPSAAPVQSGNAGTATAPRTSTNGTNANQNANDGNRTDAQRREEAERSEESRLVPPTPDAITEFQRLVQESTGQQLPIFGASLFTNVPSTFAPVENIPVSPDYVLGPGDQVRIQVFGQVNQQESLVIDRTGDITFPDVGAIHVAGVKYSDLPAFLKSQLSRVYRNFDLNVNLGQLRSIQIFVVGYARRPGSYTVSSLSTLLNALFVSGGPTAEGSLRNVELQRGGRTVDRFDLYDLLLHGDKSKDMTLAPGDVIFIPPVGSQIAVSGSVDNPAIYEILPDTTVSQGIKLSGGETAVALGTQVRIERIFDHAMRSLADVDLARIDPILHNGDIIEVGEILGRYRNAVTLRGNVASPGRYVWKEGMRITDLVPTKDQLITREYYRRRNALGTAPLGYAPPGSQTLQVRGTDSTAGSDAAVQNGSSNTSTHGGSSVGTALTSSNGVFPPANDVVLSAPDIDWTYAVIERLNEDTLITSLIPFNPGRLYLDGDQSQNLSLLPGDVVTFFSTADLKVPTTQQTRFVRLEGEFVASGIYSVEPGETLRHLLRRAGGFTPDAYLYGSEFTRQSTKRVQQQRLNEYADSVQAQIAAAAAANNARAISDQDAAATKAATEQANQTVARLRGIQPIGRIVLEVKPDSRGIDAVPDLPLEDGDRFVVPRVPSTVAVEGQVYSANAFVFVRGRKERDYLRQAGGPDRNADKKRTFILRADGSVYSRQYGDVDRATMFPGDTIVVPPNFNHRAVLRDLVDISSVIGGFGLGVAAIDLLR
jgi:protein involved in polysaccharide export with SLBB domain